MFVMHITMVYKLQLVNKSCINDQEKTKNAHRKRYTLLANIL